MYIIKEHRKKTQKNVERLMLAGFSFEKARKICGYSNEESISLKEKVIYIEEHIIDSDNQNMDESVTINIALE